VRGVVFAASAPQARARLRRLHVAAPVVRLAPLASLRALASPGFDPLDLEQFYTFAARFADRGLPRAQMLADAAGFVQDARLGFALDMAREAVREGMPLGRAMQPAGFAERDCVLVTAGEDSGRLPQVLAALAGEVRREANLQRALRGVLLSPLLVTVAGYVLAWLALVFLAPAMAEKFAQNAGVVRLPDYAVDYYAFVALFNRNLVLSTGLWLAAGAAAIAFFRSRAWHALRDAVFPPLRRVVELAEMAQLWGAFALMTDSGMGKYRIAQALARAATRPRTRGRFRRLERQLKLGVPLDQAVERAGFARYVTAGVSAAVASQAVAEGTRELAERLTLQASMQTARVQVAVTGIAALSGAAAVLAFAALTVLPQMAGVLSSF
jgi:type II secretory pathway component PulF